MNKTKWNQLPIIINVCVLCNDTYYRKKHLIFFKSEFGDTRGIKWEDRDINDVNTLFIKRGGRNMG